MTTARAVGLSPRRAVLRHAVPNALLPVIALTAMSLGYVVGGVIFIESVFSWPGHRRAHLRRAAQPRPARPPGRLPAHLGAAVIFINLLADLIIMALDPRVRAR